MKQFRVCIAGSRNFTNYNMLKQKMDMLLKEKAKDHEIIIISGHADGADKLGERYAIENEYDMEIFIPKWKKLGKRAGMSRNATMKNKADAVVVFWDGVSKGTKGMIDMCNRDKNIIKVYEY